MSNSLDAIPVITGEVINLQAFEKGGVMLLDSFKPGTGAAADDETDQLSWMMIKGIRDTLPEDNTHFTLTTDNQQDSEFYLDGLIQDYGHDGHYPNIKLHKNQNYLSIDGEIWLRSTGEKIFSFHSYQVIDLKTQNPKTVAYELGVAIAHYIGSKS